MNNPYDDISNLPQHVPHKLDGYIFEPTARLDFDAQEWDQYNADPLRHYMGISEYYSLSGRSAVLQEGINRYLARNRKTSEEIKRDYERFVGYIWENRGYSVLYTGIKKGKKDRDIDLVAKKDKHIVIIQCKCSNEKRKILPNIIAQLGGIFQIWKIENQDCNIEAHLITSSTLMVDAKKSATKLDIKVFENFFMKDDRPYVKCVERTLQDVPAFMFYLPFDPDYDKLQLIARDKKSGCYMYSVHDAERAGYRRAFGYRPIEAIRDMKWSIKSKATSAIEEDMFGKMGKKIQKSGIDLATMILPSDFDYLKPFDALCFFLREHSVEDIPGLDVYWNSIISDLRDRFESFPQEKKRILIDQYLSEEDYFDPDAVFDATQEYLDRIDEKFLSYCIDRDNAALRRAEWGQ